MKKEFQNYLEKIEKTINDSLPEKTNPQWQQISFGTAIDECVNDTHISMLTNPCKYLISLGGKRWRPLLLVLCAEMTVQAKSANESVAKNCIELAFNLTPLVEFAHTASLIHDDIEDSAESRRGKPCSHITFGIDTAINAAAWLYFEATSVIQKQKLSFEEKTILYELFLTEMRILHLGQAMDIKWHKSPSLIPAKNEYFAMVKNKTGTLARLAAKIGIFAGGGTFSEMEKCGIIAQEIGVGFQILDDVTNIKTGNHGKNRGDDIVEGKKSLPVLIHLEKNPNDKEYISKLFDKARVEGINSSSIEEAVSLLLSSGAVSEAEKIGFELVFSKSRELSRFFGKETKSGNLILELFDSMYEFPAK